MNMNLLARVVFGFASSILLVFLAACDSHGEAANNGYSTPARFVVTNDVVNPNVAPFAASISGFGNSLFSQGSGFEPPVYRNKYIATGNAPNRVYAPASVLSHWDTLREGFLDGAGVHVYRIENGHFRMVRSGHIPDGGFHVSGWQPLIQGDQILPAETRRYAFHWANYNRPDAQYYFAVRAIDRSGKLSPTSNVYSIERPDKVVEGKDTNQAITFKPLQLTFDSSPPAAPKNLRGRVYADGSLVLEWDPVTAPDLAGYLVYMSDYPPQAQKGYYFDIAGPAMSADQYIKAGDMVVVDKKFYRASRNQSLSNRVWGVQGEYGVLLPGLVDFFSDESDGKSWELVPHEADSPVGDGGETYLKVHLGASEKAQLGEYNHSGTAQSWYQVLEPKPYKVEFWMRVDGPGRARFLLTGFYHDSIPSVKPIDFRAGPQWQKFTATFTPPMIQKSDRPNQMILELIGPGTFSIDNLRVYRADLGYMEMPPEDYDAIRRSGMQALRTHGIVNTRFRTYDLEQLTNPPGVSSGTQKLNTLPQILSMMRKAAVNPWLQLEFHLSPEEWLGFVEYMAAPYDPAKDTPEQKPWAYKRYQQGQVRPWTDEFSRIYFELSNETWNRLFLPWNFDPMADASSGKQYTAGQVYGMYQEYVRSILRTSPYWQAAGLDRKFSFVLGGWANQNYGNDAASTSPSSSYVTIATYNGGWDEAEGPPKRDALSFFNLLNQVSQVAIPEAIRHGQEVQVLRAQGHAGLAMGTYEAGPGYALNGLNNEKVSKDQAQEQEQVMKSLAAGTATLDAFLARAYRGFNLQNFFTFDHGELWKSHAAWFHGGQAYPSWKLLSLFNTQAAGDMLRTETLSVPRADLNKYMGRQLVEKAPLVAVYATHQRGRYCVFVISRKVPGYPVAGDDGYTPVSIDLPFGRARQVALYRMAGDPMANNILADDVKVEKIPLVAQGIGKHFTVNEKNGADRRGLPPAATYLYIFEGVSR